jgi:DNA processing protein
VRDRAYWLAWSQISGVGAIIRKRIYQRFESMELAWDAGLDDLLSIDGIGSKLGAAIVTQRPTIDPDRLLDEYFESNPNFITPADPEYPRTLWEIPDPPALLHYQGNLDLLRSSDAATNVALVGTRKASDYGNRWTSRLSRSLSQHGWTIVSGLAAGIDAVAHQSCLDAGGRTIGVLGTGIDIVYPTSNRKLYEQMAKTGLILSEYSAGTPADRAHFPARNRIVAGLCRATIVLEAGLGSGALITARQANDYGRDVHVLAGSLDNPEAAGGLELISQGAAIITSEAGLLAALGTIVPVTQLDLFAVEAVPIVVTKPTPIDLKPELQTIWQIIAASQEPVVLDTIVETTGLPTGNVLSGLLELELMGAISEQAGMRYQVA